MTKRGTGGDFTTGNPGESSDIYANLENKIQVLRFDLNQSGGDITQLQADVLAAQGDITTLDSRVDALEIPPPFLNGGASVNWTTEKQAIINYSIGNSELNLTATVLEWPILETRVVSKYNLTAFTVALQPTVTGVVNGEVAGTLVVLENSADIPGGALGAGRWYVQRMGPDEWWSSKGA